ncbi:MAG: hypothetical protein AAF800_03160 [Planctomycetota bacterium]
MGDHPRLRPGWCHCVAGTYGSWLPGDPRGFRTRGHREHVEGDYKSPPEEDYSVRHAVAREKMSGNAVVLSTAARQVVRLEVVDSLLRRDVELLAVAVAATHLHVLGRFPCGKKPTFGERGLPATSAVKDPVRHFMGQAKQWSAKRLKHEGLISAPHVWAKRGKIVRVRDRPHQLNVLRYILRHADEGAAVWSWRGSDITKKPTD